MKILVTVFMAISCSMAAKASSNYYCQDQNNRDSSKVHYVDLKSEKYDEADLLKTLGKINTSKLLVGVSHIGKKSLTPKGLLKRGKKLQERVFPLSRNFPQVLKKVVESFRAPNTEAETVQTLIEMSLSRADVFLTLAKMTDDPIAKDFVSHQRNRKTRIRNKEMLLSFVKRQNPENHMRFLSGFQNQFINATLSSYPELSETSFADKSFSELLEEPINELIKQAQQAFYNKAISELVCVREEEQLVFLLSSNLAMESLKTVLQDNPNQVLIPVDLRSLKAIIDKQATK